MLRSYFIIAWRNLFRNKTFSFIKIIGLSIGLMFCMLILLYTKDELSYDQFHANKSVVYRIIQFWKFGDNPPQTLGITNGVMGPSFAKEIPEVKAFVRLNGVEVTTKRNNDLFTESPLFVDDNFFSVFTFPVIEGDKETALKDLHSIVLSKDMANKYFGTPHAIGKIIQLKLDEEFENYTVTAITENSPQNSTLKVEMLMPYNSWEKYNSNKGWFGGSLNTFLMLTPQANIKEVEKKMQLMFDKNTKEKLAKAKEQEGNAVNIKLGLQPLTEIHLSTRAGPDNGMAGGSNPAYSYILSCIAIFILVIACINFINLAIGQSLKRSKEIGIRKVVGSSRKQLIKQFLAESFLVSSIAFGVALLLTNIVLPFFNELANKKLSFSYLSDGYLYAGYLLLLIVTSFIAGFYPSLVLSGFQPIRVLYSKQKLLGRNYLTKGLIVLQFTLAIFLIIGTVAVYSQLNFFLRADLGYDSRNLVRIDIPVRKSSDKLPALFKSELAGQPSILSVAARNGGRSITGVKADGKNITIETNRIDDKYLPTFKIPIIAGRNFSQDYPSDTLNSIIVNESFLKEAGWSLDKAVGKTVRSTYEEKRSYTIIGVIKDYHFTSLKEKITAEMFTMNPDFNFGQIWVKVKPTDVPKTLSLLRNTYKKLVPYFPYSYQFMDDIHEKDYESEAKWKQVIGISALLFVFISCIGLFGLIILSIEQRTKEIGIRKVLGAAVSRLVVLISKDFIILIALAFLISLPLGYYAVNKWLEDFAYRMEVHWWLFAIPGIIVIGTAMLTLCTQAIRAAMANPVKSLRTE